MIKIKNQIRNCIFILDVSPCTPTNGFLHSIIFQNTILPFLRMTFKLFFLKYFYNILSKTYFMNSEFTIIKIKKICFGKHILE